METIKNYVHSRLKNLTKNQRMIGAAGIALVLIVIAHAAFRPAPPLPDDTMFQGIATFMYPRALTLEEYTGRAVSVGTTTTEGDFLPLVQVVEYRNDPDVALPADFEAFARRQAIAFCGSDGIESVTCSAPVVEPYTSPGGYEGLHIALTLTRRNLASGTTTTATYAPIYVFDTSTEPDPDEARRFTGLFVYPALPAVLQGLPTEALMEQIMRTILIEDLEKAEAAAETAASAPPAPPAVGE